MGAKSTKQKILEKQGYISFNIYSTLKGARIAAKVLRDMGAATKIFQFGGTYMSKSDNKSYKLMYRRKGITKTQGGVK